MPDIDALRTRVEQVKKSIWLEKDGQRSPQNIQGGIQTTISVLSSVYGTTSNQVRSFQDRVKKGRARAKEATEETTTTTTVE